MKKLTILFICGSMQKGKDGVGDYTRQIAGELIRQGHEVNVIALDDKYVEQICLETQIDDLKTSLTVMRLPSMFEFKKHEDRVYNWVNSLNPQWISLQFVPFAYHKKGLFVNLSKRLAGFGTTRKWHIMFHELWVGMDHQATLKMRLWGAAQKQLIRSMIRHIQPQIIHTQAKVYQAYLEDLGCQVKYLPLVSNVSLVSAPLHFANQTVEERLKGAFNLVIFGSIHRGAPVLQFAKEVAQYAKEKKLITSLRIIGRSGSEKEYWTSIFYSEGLSVDILGELSPTSISSELLKADLGITTTPLLLVEKSGTVAAMHAHGLPVICVAKSWVPRTRHFIRRPENIMKYEVGNFKDCMKLRQQEVDNSLETITDEFVTHLSIPVISEKLLYTVNLQT